jgi:hypothetical protein
LDDVLEAARKQWDEETPAQWQDCTECAEKAKRAEKERDEARAVADQAKDTIAVLKEQRETLRDHLARAWERTDKALAERDEARARLGVGGVAHDADTCCCADCCVLREVRKERDEARAQARADLHSLQNAHEALADAVEAQSAALRERDEARAESKKYEELMWHYKAAFEYLKSPAKACLDERAEGNGGCGACSVCCGELRDKLEAIERQADRFQRLLTEVRAASEIEPELGARIDKALVANPYAYTPVFSGPPPQTGLILPPVPKQTLTDPSQSKENK